MKRISWIAGLSAALLVGSVGVALLVAEAAPGWPTFVQRSSVAPVALNTTAKACLATWVGVVWTGATPAALSSIDCIGVGDETAVEVTCSATDEHTYTATEYVVAEAAGKTSREKCDFSVPTEATCKRTWGPTELDAAQEAALGACLEGQAPQINGDLLTKFEMRHAGGTVRTGVAHWHSTCSAVDYLVLLRDKLVVERAGTVEPIP